MPEKGKKSAAPPEKKEFRDLTTKEQELCFSLFKKHKGNVSAISEDADTPFKNRNQVAYYRDKYGWDSKLQQITAENIEKELEQSRELLLAGKLSAIRQAVKQVGPHEVTVLDKAGQPVLDPGTGLPIIVMVDPMYKQLKSGWEIIKTELGEPTYITKNEQIIDDSELQEATTFLKDMISDEIEKEKKEEDATNKDKKPGEATTERGGDKPTAGASKDTKAKKEKTT